MNLTTWLNEQARLVRVALMNGDLAAARNALRFTFEDGDAPDGIRPAMIIRLALFPLADEEIDAVRDAFTRGAEHIFVDGDDLDAEIREDMYSALFRDRK